MVRTYGSCQIVSLSLFYLCISFCPQNLDSKFSITSFYDKKDSDIQFFVDMNDHCLLFIEKITTKHKEQPKYNIKS